MFRSVICCVVAMDNGLVGSNVKSLIAECRSTTIRNDNIGYIPATCVQRLRSDHDEDDGGDNDVLSTVLSQVHDAYVLPPATSAHGTIRYDTRVIYLRVFLSVAYLLLNAASYDGAIWHADAYRPDAGHVLGFMSIGVVVTKIMTFFQKCVQIGTDSVRPHAVGLYQSAG